MVKSEPTVQVKSGRMSTICSLCAPMVRTEDNISALTESKAVLPLGFFFPASSLWMRKSLYKYARYETVNRRHTATGYLFPQQYGVYRR